MKTSLAGKILLQLSTYYRGRQHTTNNDSWDRINSNQLYQFFTCPSVFHGNITHPSNHLHLCYFNFNPTSASKGMVSHPYVMLLLTQLTYTQPFISSGGALDVRKCKTSRNFIHPFLILAVAARSAQPSP